MLKWHRTVVCKWGKVSSVICEFKVWYMFYLGDRSIIYHIILKCFITGLSGTQLYFSMISNYCTNVTMIRLITMNNIKWLAVTSMYDYLILLLYTYIPSGQEVLKESWGGVWRSKAFYVVEINLGVICLIACYWGVMWAEVLVYSYSIESILTHGILNKMSNT